MYVSACFEHMFLSCYGFCAFAGFSMLLFPVKLLFRSIILVLALKMVDASILFNSFMYFGCSPAFQFIFSRRNCILLCYAASIFSVVVGSYVTIRGFGTPWRTHNDILKARFLQFTYVENTSWECGIFYVKPPDIITQSPNQLKRLDTYDGKPP